MKLKNLFAAVVTSLGIAAAAPASAIVVGGIDFGVLGDTQHLETATLAETFVNANGQELQGYGRVTTVNGESNYCAGGGTCTLYYFFHDYIVTSFAADEVLFSGGVVDLYFANAPLPNLLTQNSPANVAAITGLTLWAQFTGHTFLDGVNATVQTLFGTGSLTGASLSTTGTGQLDAVEGVGVAGVGEFLNGNSIGDNLGGFSDVVVTTSSNNNVLNPLDVSGGFATGCATGTAAPGAWCFQGTLNTRGDTNLQEVPEPSPLVLLGLGIVGLVWMRSRKTA